MSVISVKNLTFRYDGSSEYVFDNVDFNIDSDWKLGLVGRNGRGKTTFLKILSGAYEYSGKVVSSEKFVYFPFEVADKERPAGDLLREICPSAEEWEIIREMSYLGLTADELYMPFSALSNGEQTKLLLAGLFLNRGEFFLIDEPTNHLDIDARATVSAYLKRKKGFIVVSHDRAFLDGCIDHVMSINKSNIEIRSGNFSSYLENFEREQENEAEYNERLKKDIARLTEASRRTSGWADMTEKSKNGRLSSGLKPDKGAVGHKAAKLMKQAKVTEARQQKAIEQKSELFKNTERSEPLKMSPLECRSDRLLAFSDVSVYYGDRAVCTGINFEVKRGDRIALDGKNGCGKSSVLKLAVGENIKYAGNVTIASGLVVSYVPQSTDGISGRLADMAKTAGIDDSLFMTVLRKMGFERSDFDADVSGFSLGQKKKVCLAAGLCKRAHLYVWDEPLNYIDIYSRLQIEKLLIEYAPTMIFVEHDKAFRDAVATETVTIGKV